VTFNHGVEGSSPSALTNENRYLQHSGIGFLRLGHARGTIANASRHMKREQKITLGEMRQSDPRRLQIFCGDYKCAHSVVINADPWGRQCAVIGPGAEIHL
jgi:hypothetical protein